METPAIFNNMLSSNTLDYSTLYTTTSGTSPFYQALVTDDKPKKKERPMAGQDKKRIVEVYIADSDENIPLDKALIYQGERKFTDLNDQELFFDIEIKPLLENHNEYRKTLVDKRASTKAGKDIMLEPIKIRDLKMTIVTIAEF
jgi:hypothetical protein